MRNFLDKPENLWYSYRKGNYLFGKNGGGRAVRISFENGRTEELFEDYKAMHKKIGAEKTRAVKKHMDRLRASGSFQTFLKLGLGKPHLLKENLAGCYAISISGNMAAPISST